MKLSECGPYLESKPYIIFIVPSVSRVWTLYVEVWPIVEVKCLDCISSKGFHSFCNWSQFQKKINIPAHIRFRQVARRRYPLFNTDKYFPMVEWNRSHCLQGVNVASWIDTKLFARAEAELVGTEHQHCSIKARENIWKYTCITKGSDKHSQVDKWPKTFTLQAH